MRNNIILGIILSIGVTVMVVLTQQMHLRGTEYIDVMVVNTFVMLLSTWFLHLWLLSNDNYKQLIPRIWVRNIVSVIVVSAVVYFMLELLSLFIEAPEIKRHIKWRNRHIERWTSIRVLTWNIIYHWILFSQQIIVENKKAELKMSRAKELALDAKLTSFREQLSPHFMFNSLNTLSSMTEDVAVQRFVDRLAGVYRYLLTNKDRKTVSVAEELEFLLKYWYILKERFGDAIDLQTQFTSNTNELLIPPMALQTLLENAIKHNKATNRMPLKVTITEQDDYIIVTNAIQHKSIIDESTGIGLHNLVERYRLLFNKEVIITQNENFTVKLPIVRI